MLEIDKGRRRGGERVVYSADDFTSFTLPSLPPLEHEAYLIDSPDLCYCLSAVLSP